MDEQIRAALESETKNLQMPQGTLKRIRSKARLRRFLMAAAASGLVTFTGVAISRLPVPTLASDAIPAASAPGNSGETIVPDVVGMIEGDALKALYVAGLEASVSYKITDGAPVGTVLETIPASGIPSADGSVSVLVARLEPESIGPSHSNLAALARITESRPDVFVGVYRDSLGDLHAVFNPGIDKTAWSAQLEAAVPIGVSLHLDQCSVTRGALLELLNFLGRRDWGAHAPQVRFAAEIEPATCGVVMTTRDLTSEDKDELTQRFGSMIAFDESTQPRMYGDQGDGG